jgi:hypothetical protein
MEDAAAISGLPEKRAELERAVAALNARSEYAGRIGQVDGTIRMFAPS